MLSTMLRLARSSWCQEHPYRVSSAQESAMHAIFDPQEVGMYPQYAPTSWGPHLSHLSNPALDAIL